MIRDPESLRYYRDGVEGDIIYSSAQLPDPESDSEPKGELRLLKIRRRGSDRGMLYCVPGRSPDPIAGRGCRIGYRYRL